MPGSAPADPLHYANVLDVLARVLGPGLTGSLPRNRAELAAAALHAAMTALGFRLEGLGETDGGGTLAMPEGD